MSEHSHDEIMKERKKAQHDLIELKKMQHGDIPIPPKPSEEAILPDSFKKKKENFWFYHKYHVFITIFIAVFLIVVISQCANRVKYDCTVVLTMKQSVSEETVTAMEKQLEQYCDDYNGDGQVHVQVIDCAYNADTDDQQSVLAKVTKYQAQFTSPDSILFIVDKASFDSFDQLMEGGLMDTSVGLPDCGGKALDLKGTAFDEAVSQASNYSFKDDYYIVKRVVDGTAINGKKSTKTYEQQAVEILNKMVQAYKK